MTAPHPIPESRRPPQATVLAPPGSGYPEGSVLPARLGEVIVRAEGLQKWFGDNHVLRGIDLEVRQR
jgi:hypothetical protein